MPPAIKFAPVKERDLATAYALLQQLREQLVYYDFLAIYAAANAANQYTLTGAFARKKLVGLVGHRVLYDFLHGKHMYIDDLVIDVEFRSVGIGAGLLRHAEQLAALAGCNGVRLSTGKEHVAGIRFYLREGWDWKANTFKKGFNNLK